MSDQIPDYRDYDDEYERYLKKLVPGPFIYDITMTEAKEYFYNDVITQKLIQFTLQYIKTQIRRNVTVEINFITDTNQIQAIKSTSSNYSIAVTVIKDILAAFLWDTINQEILMIDRNPQIENAFINQRIIRIDSITKDFISIMAGIYIRAINHANFKLNFIECQRQALMKWVLLKQYRELQMKENGESFSRILDDQLLKEVNKSKQQEQKSISQQISQIQHSQKQDNMSYQKSNSQNQNSFNPSSKRSQYSQKQGQNQISQSHISLPSTSRVDTMKDQISMKEFVQGMENIKNQILLDVPQPDELKPKDYTLKPIIPFFSPEQVFRVKVDDLEQLLKEQVKNQKIQEPNPADQLQQLLTYYSQHNPEQYKILLNQYSDYIHEKMFEGMGLPSSTKSQMKVKPEFQQQQALRQSIQIPKSKSMLFTKQPQMQPQLYQEEIVAIKFNRKINRQEFELLKQKLVLSQNIMEFYFSHLQEEFKRVLIFQIEFYNVLSQNPQKAQSFTDQYQGRNRTIFDQFDKVFVPVKVSQYEYVGVYIDFQNKTMYYINTLERRDRKQPPYKELVDQPVMHFIMKFIENEYNLKVMRAFNILNWKFVEFMNDYAQNFNYSGLVLTYVIDSICNHKSAVGDNQILKDFAQKILDSIRRAGSKK